jgi:hypothetical protein
LATITGTAEGGGGAVVRPAQLHTGEINSTAIKLREKFIKMRINLKLITG